MAVGVCLRIIIQKNNGWCFFSKKIILQTDHRPHGHRPDDDDDEHIGTRLWGINMIQRRGIHNEMTKSVVIECYHFEFFLLMMMMIEWMDSFHNNGYHAVLG